MKQKELVDKVTSSLPRKKITQRDDGFDAADHETPIEVEAFNEGFNQFHDLAVPVVAKLNLRIEELEEKLKTAQLEAYGEALKNEGG